MGAPRIRAVGTANPPRRFTQEEAFRLAGYTSPRILNIFLNSDIDYRHFYLDPATFTPNETADELNRRYLRGAMETGCRAVESCLTSAGLSPRATWTCSRWRAARVTSVPTWAAA